MGKLVNVIMQKLIPATKKSNLILFRKPNGAWTEFMVPPSQKQFKVKGSTNIYYLKGVPDIDDTTNQRRWTFVSEISHPIKYHTTVPELIEVEKNKGNLQMQLIESDQQGYERGILMKGQKENNFIFYILIIVAFNLIVTIVGLYLIADKLGIRFT